MSEKKQTTDEVIDSLTGFEEVAIREQLGRAIGELIGEPGMYRRALIFVCKRREGLSEDDARNEVLGMRLLDVLEFFAEAGTPAAVESGKDETPSEPKPETLLPSAS